jgi:hypothetical protein
LFRNIPGRQPLTIPPEYDDAVRRRPPQPLRTVIPPPQPIFVRSSFKLFVFLLTLNASLRKKLIQDQRQLLPM